MVEMHSFFAPCARGVDRYLADELRAMRIRGVRPQRSGVAFTGTVADAYRALMWSRLASRVLMHVAQVDASSDQSFYDGMKKIAWEEHLSPTSTLAVYSSGTNGALRNTKYTNVRAKDAIVDRMRDKFGSRPSVDSEAPDVSVNIVVWEGRAKVSIDLAGEPLHQRGYRQPALQAIAPMKETLAASVLAAAGWAEIAAAGGAFVDPMCGSGTLTIEAAMIAGDIAPGFKHRRWGFTRWKQHDAPAWERMLAEVETRRAAGASKVPPIVGSDIDARTLDIARKSVRRAELSDKIDLFRADIMQWAPTDELRAKLDARPVPGLIAINPPYGERLSGETDCQADLCHAVGSFARGLFPGWRIAIIHPKPDQVAAGLGLKPIGVHELYNGPIAAPVSVFQIPS